MPLPKKQIKTVKKKVSDALQTIDSIDSITNPINTEPKKAKRERGRPPIIETPRHKISMFFTEEFLDRLKVSIALENVKRKKSGCAQIDRSYLLELIATEWFDKNGY